MKKTNYSIKKIFRKGLATLLTASMVVTAVQAPAFAESAEEVTESSASVSGIIHKKITLELLSDDLKEAALTAIRENRLFDAEDYLGATGDNQKALKEYEAFFNENPGLYIVDAPESVQDTLSGEDAELRIFVQKDAKMATVDLTASPSEITKEDSTESKNVEFRYGTDKDIILYEPSSQVDTLVNGGEDAYYVEPEQENADNSDYELTGNEKITFMFVNASDEKVSFTLKVDGVTYDKVEVGGRKAALQKIINEAGIKKSTEETTVAETTKEETTVAAEVSEETTSVEETTAAEVKDAETEAPAEETTAEVTEAAGTDAAEITTDTNDSSTVVEETAAETEKETEAAETESDVKVEVEAEETTEASEELETEATIPEKIAEAVSDAFDGVGDVVLGRMTVYAGVVAEGVEFDPETEAPAAEDSGEEEEKETDGVVAEAVEAAAGEDTADETDEVKSEAVEAADDSTALENAVAEGISEDEAEDQVQETEAVETTAAETVAVAETEAPKEEIKKVDETKAAVKSESKKVASESEITEYDDFAKELIAEVKEEVLQDKEAAKENIKIAKIAQYTINELGKIHYEAEVDGFNVEVFAEKKAFGNITPTLEVKKLAKPEEAKASEDKLSDEQVAKLKAGNIYHNSQSLDIHFLDKSGKEVEPTEKVKVRITLSDEELLNKIDASSLEVHHLKETNDTLKTEKVAAAKDVTLLDKNDEEIKDSDLVVDESAASEGEGAEVEVASAVAEFEVDSFSVYTIKWNYLGYNDFTVRVHYVDQTGKEILDNTSGLNLTLSLGGEDVELTGQNENIKPTEQEVNLAQWEGGVSTYEFVEARLGNINGKVIESVSAIRGSNDTYVEYFDHNGKMVAQDVANDLEESTDGACTDKGRLIYYLEGDYLHPLYNEKINGRDLYYYYDYSWHKYNSTKRYTWYHVNDIYLVYKEKDGTTGGELPELDSAPDAKKTITNNNDGTYTLTLSVTGAAKSKTSNSSANVLVILDTSGSMGDVTDDSYKLDNRNGTYGYYSDHYIQLYKSGNKWYMDSWHWYEYTGDRYSLIDNPRTRLDVAKDAIGNLAHSLFEYNKNNANTIEMGLITFSTRVNSTLSKTSNESTIVNAVNALTANGGTNWEAALDKATTYDFEDDDPVYIVFVSDGEPTFRISQNGHYDGGSQGAWGAGDHDNYGYNLEAAVKVAKKLENQGKHLYAIGAFGDISKMKQLLSDESHYTDATNEGALNEAFSNIVHIVTNSVGYTNVSFTDGMTSLTASVAVLGNPESFTYKIVKSDGTEVTDTDKINPIKTATYNKATNSVDWNVGGENYVLEDGTTYSVSFVVWPEQDAYDTLAEVLDVDPTTLPAADVETVKDENDKEFIIYKKQYVYDKEKKTWSYRTNTGASVSYKTVKIKNENGTQTQVPSTTTYTSSVSTFPTMSLVDTKVSAEKVWKLTNKDQKNLLTGDNNNIVLSLKKKVGTEYQDYKTELVLNDTNKEVSEDEKTITWKNDISLDIAPGILVSEAKGNEHGFNLLLNDTERDIKLVSGYYIIEKGHDYKFVETKGNAHFELVEKVYHPMIVDGVLKDVEFEYDETGKVIKSIKNLANIELTTLVATNEIKTDELVVSKKFTGNMAAAHAATFELHLYDETGTTHKKYAERFIEDLEHEGVTLTNKSDGVYEFTITPAAIETETPVTITLPADAVYKIVEVDDGKGYTAKWGTDATNLTQGLETGTYKLSEYHSIYFVNEKKIDPPTGFSDNVSPFVVLALAGLAAMVFLAYDFQKRRLFED
ncbi:vWA domain-containing protein [Oribacterium sp. FC2011]|uniref:vWA domain-containing protein n=1 Tax=Oribacterium sp. FC2011 TaxID=1408311 RepID=UPI0004E0DAF9|nr:vWA domain-containing protein [Oribacterium sp. FC2011]